MYGFRGVDVVGSTFYWLYEFCWGYGISDYFSREVSFLKVWLIYGFG